MMPSIAPNVMAIVSTNVRSLWNYVNNTNDAQTKKVVPTNTVMLDPMTTIFKLCLLKYKPKNTKIGIHANKLVFYEPVVYQGISRWIAGDSRHDIQYINLPILYFCAIKHNYIKSIFNSCPKKSETIAILNSMLINGLTILKEMYENQGCSNMITNCIESYIHLLVVNDDLSGFIKMKYENILNTVKLNYDEYTNQWSIKYIDILLDLFKELDTHVSDTYDKHIIMSIEHMLNTMDDVVDKVRS